MKTKILLAFARAIMLIGLFAMPVSAIKTPPVCRQVCQKFVSGHPFCHTVCTQPNYPTATPVPTDVPTCKPRPVIVHQWVCVTRIGNPPFCHLVYRTLP